MSLKDDFVFPSVVKFPRVRAASQLWEIQFVLWTKHAGAKKLGGFAVKQQHNFKLIIWSFCSVCFYVGRICISFVWLQYISRRKQWGWKLAWSNKITSAPVNRFICFFLYAIDLVVSNVPPFPWDRGCLPTVGIPKLLASEHAFLGVQSCVLTSDSQFIFPKAQRSQCGSFSHLKEKL